MDNRENEKLSQRLTRQILECLQQCLSDSEPQMPLPSNVNVTITMTASSPIITGEVMRNDTFLPPPQPLRRSTRIAERRKRKKMLNLEITQVDNQGETVVTTNFEQSADSKAINSGINNDAGGGACSREEEANLPKDLIAQPSRKITKSNNVDIVPLNDTSRMEDSDLRDRIVNVSCQVIGNNLTGMMSRESVSWLICLQTVFYRHLPNLPREYITKLMFDSSHRNIVLLKEDKVIGGVCFRDFPNQGFSEVVFCAVEWNEQAKGYGAYLMNQLKDYQVFNKVLNLLTYADNAALEYFAKLGFSENIKLNKSQYLDFIKTYTGATLMHCELNTTINYSISSQKKQMMTIMNLDCPKLHDNNHKRGNILTNVDQELRLMKLYKQILRSVKIHRWSWPFKKPVDSQLAPDYYKVVKFPMDLATMTERLGKGFYVDQGSFISDMRLILSNCRQYNAEDTEYYECANKLEVFFKNKCLEHNIISFKPEN